MDEKGQWPCDLSGKLMSYDCKEAGHGFGTSLRDFLLTTHVVDMADTRAYSVSFCPLEVAKDGQPRESGPDGAGMTDSMRLGPYMPWRRH